MRRLPSEVFGYAEKLLGRLPGPDADKAAKVLEELLEPDRCWEKFLKPEDKAALPDCYHEDDLEDEEGIVVVPAGPMASVKESFNKATGMLFDLLLELVSGKHLADCQQIANQPSGLAKLLAEMETADDAGDAVDLLKQLHLVTTLFDGQTSKSVSASSAVPAPSLLSQLAATGEMNCEVDLDRERAWKSVQAERRKLASFSIPKTWSKDALLASFRGCGKVFSHNGILNTSHRLFVASADLLVEHGDEPWANSSVPPAGLWKEIVTFLGATASGPADFIMAFDGRMRDVRRWNAPWCFYCFVQSLRSFFLSASTKLCTKAFGFDMHALNSLCIILTNLSLHLVRRMICSPSRIRASSLWYIRVDAHHAQGGLAESPCKPAKLKQQQFAAQFSEAASRQLARSLTT